MLVAVSSFLIWTTLQLIDNTLAHPLAFQKLNSRAPLISGIPECANSCLQSFLQTSFPQSVCGIAPNFGCLCTSRGLQGLTLGEGALRCVVSDCPDVSQNQFAQVYAICNGVVGAARPTHSVLTAQTRIQTPLTTTSAQIISAQTTSVSESITTGVPTAIVPRSTSATSISPLDSSTAVTTAPTSAASSSSPTPVLTTPGIIGLSVGLSVLGLIAMACLGYIYCFRKRSSRDSIQSFGDNQPFMSHAEVPGNLTLSPGTLLEQPYLPSKAASVLGRGTPVWSPVVSPQRNNLGSYAGFAFGSRNEDYRVESALTYPTISKLPLNKPSRPGRDGTETDGILLKGPPGRSGKSRNAIKASPESFTSGPILHKQPSDPFLQATHDFPSPPSSSIRATTRDLPRIATQSVRTASAENQTVEQLGLVSNTPNYAQTRAPNWTSPVQYQAGLAITTNAIVNPPDLRRAYKPVPRLQKAPHLNKDTPLPPSTRRGTVASIATSFETDFELEEAEPVPLLPRLPFARNVTAPKPLEIQSKRMQSNPQLLTHPIRKESLPMEEPNITPLSQIRYPTIPTSQTPVSQPVSAIASAHPVQRRFQAQHHQRNDSPFEVSPMTPQTHRQEGFTLPHWNRIPIPDQETYSGLYSPNQTIQRYTPPLPPPPPTIELSASSETASPWERTANGTRLQFIPPASKRMDASRLLHHGFVELPERGSSQRSRPEESITKQKPYQGSPQVKHTPATPPRFLSTAPNPSSSASTTPSYAHLHPATSIDQIAELPSPDAERLLETPFRGGAVSTTTTTTRRKSSRGARLGAAIANSPLQPKTAAELKTTRVSDVDNNLASHTHLNRSHPPTQSTPSATTRTSPSSTRDARLGTAGAAAAAAPARGRRVARTEGSSSIAPESASLSRDPRNQDQYHHQASRSGRTTTTRDVNEGIRGTAKYAVLCGTGQQQQQHQQQQHQQHQHQHQQQQQQWQQQRMERSRGNFL